MPERRRSGVFIVNFEHILTPFSSVSIVYFEQVNVGWVVGKHSFKCNKVNFRVTLRTLFQFMSVIFNDLLMVCVHVFLL